MKKILLPFLLLFTFACEDMPKSKPPSAEDESKRAAKTQLTVFKDPNCGCCSEWIEHLEERSFEVNPVDTSKLQQIKHQHGIPNAYHSCHTAVSKEGYFFEGHIPAKTIARFMKEKPQGALGLTVPAMPAGSPGMEMGDKFMPYKVFMMKQDGSMETYAEFKSYQEQF